MRVVLFLSYDYLRLYVNAFAYQATMSRALAAHRDEMATPHKKAMPLPQLDASVPDARFIYEAVDAAQSLLSRYVEHDRQGALRCMPSPYYLYIIYSAVFLYKARSTTSMSAEERLAVRNTVSATIDRLQRNSMGPHHMGSRYARLLSLLWRKHTLPDHGSISTSATQGTSSTSHPHHHVQNPASVASRPHVPSASMSTPPNHFSALHSAPLPAPVTPVSFSWLDLGSTWNFATRKHDGGVGSIGSASSLSGDLDDITFAPTHGGGHASMASNDSFDTTLSTPLMTVDYSVLDGNNPNFIF